MRHFRTFESEAERDEKEARNRKPIIEQEDPYRSHAREVFYSSLEDQKSPKFTPYKQPKPSPTQTAQEIFAHYWNILTRHITEDDKDRENAAKRILTKIFKKHSEPNRAYHNVTHLLELFEKFEAIKAYIKDPDLVVAVIFWHDIVYRTDQESIAKGFNNEAASAKMAVRDLTRLGFSPTFVVKVKESILMTRNHLTAETDDMDIKYFLDMDISILGSPRARYAQYALEQIPYEYKVVPNDTFNTRRLSFLDKFLKEVHIYKTPYFQSNYGDRTHSNLAWEHEQRTVQPQ